MTWYYQEGNQTHGPISKSDLQKLIKAKKVTGGTLVRNDAMNEWRPLREMVNRKPHNLSDQKQNPPPPPIKKADTPGADAGQDHIQPPQATAVCSQCGRSFPQDQVLRYDEQVICAACKPIFVQRLKEGVAPVGALRYGGFWIRFVAKLIDGIIMGVVQWAIFIPMSMMAVTSLPQNPNEISSGFFMVMGFQQLIGILIPAAYTTFFIGRFAATPGKMACRLKVVMPDGGKVSYMRALGRNFAEIISGIILFIGYIMAAFDDQKRTLHDRICSTRVVHK